MTASNPQNSPTIDLILLAKGRYECDDKIEGARVVCQYHFGGTSQHTLNQSLVNMVDALVRRGHILTRPDEVADFLMNFRVSSDPKWCISQLLHAVQQKPSMELAKSIGWVDPVPDPDLRQLLTIEVDMEKALRELLNYVGYEVSKADVSKFPSSRVVDGDSMDLWTTEQEGLLLCAQSNDAGASLFPCMVIQTQGVFDVPAAHPIPHRLVAVQAGHSVQIYLNHAPLATYGDDVIVVNNFDASAMKAIIDHYQNNIKGKHATG